MKKFAFLMMFLSLTVLNVGCQNKPADKKKDAAKAEEASKDKAAEAEKLKKEADAAKEREDKVDAAKTEEKVEDAAKKDATKPAKTVPADATDEPAADDTK